jgi:hypothetical protein
MIKYVAHVDVETGKVVGVAHPQFNTPTHISMVGNQQAVHIRDDNMPENCEDPQDLMRCWYYDTVSDEFKFVGEPPNEYASWDAREDGWVWDVPSMEKDIRRNRNSLLLQSDWTQMPDSPLSGTQRGEWADYRQALRDLFQEVDFSTIDSHDKIPWPVAP